MCQLKVEIILRIIEHIQDNLHLSFSNDTNRDRA